MAYTKTNLNETTETVVVDMTAEDIENDETTETVAEQNTRGYSKTVWNESTPITADKLNKMETGIANGIDKTEQVMEIPITNSNGWQQFRWTRPNCNTVSWTRDANAGKAIEIYNETTRNRLLLLDDYGNLTTTGNLVFTTIGGGELTANIANSTLHANTGNGQMLNVGYNNVIYVGNPQTPLTIESSSNPIINIGRSSYQLYHTGNFNPNTKLDAGYFTIHDRDLRVHGKRAMVGFNTADGDYLEINYGKDFANGVAIQGLTKIGSMETPGKLTFYNQLGGGQMNSLINCQELQNNTGNGQMLTASVNRIFVGNPNTQLVIESSSTPIVNANGGSHSLYHTGNKPTANDVGALPNSGGTITGALRIDGDSKVMTMGTGPNDVYIANSSSGAFLQLKDDGLLRYNNNLVYHEGFKPTPWDIGAMTTSNPTFNGNLNQDGPNGHNWIYHINADRGTLNIAPKVNGNPDWGKQIFIDRNGQIHCNGNRRVATINQENPAHHIIRYGAGMGGENGYITFSW